MYRRMREVLVGLMFGMVMLAGQLPVLPEVAKAPLVGSATAAAAPAPVAAVPVVSGQPAVAASPSIPAEAPKNSVVPEQKGETPAVSSASAPVVAPTPAAPTAVAAPSVEKASQPAQPAEAGVAAPVVAPAPAATVSKEGAAPVATSSAPAAQPAAAPTPEKQTVASTDEGISGIDTVDIEEPEGNWLFKRLWFEKAEDRFDQIREQVSQVTRLYEGFLAKRTALDHDLFDQFYKTTGFARGELEEVLSYLMERVEDMRAKKGALQENEREFFSMLQSEQENLKKLQLDIEAINKIDTKIDDAIKELTDLLNKCRTWEGQSWQNLRQIARELSHTKAKKLYSDILTYEDNIVAVADYIQKPFNLYFDKQTQTAREQATRVQDSLKSLKERGLDFVKQAEALGLRERAQRAAAEQEEMGVKPTTFWGYVAATPKAVWRFGKTLVTAIWQQTKDSVMGVITLVKGLFVEKREEPGSSMPPVPVTQPSPTAAPGIAPTKQ